MPDGNISDFEENHDEEKELDPDYVSDENVNSRPLEIEVERCDPMDGAATTSSIDQMKSPTATNDQLDGSAVTLSTDQLAISSAPANSTTSGQHNDPITPSFSYRWRKRDLLITDHIAFTGSFSDLPHEIPTSLQYFRQVLSKEFMEYIACQSNLCATQKDGKVLGTSFGEIEQFIGILLLTGVFICTSYSHYIGLIFVGLI